VAERRSAAFLVFENSAFRHQWSELQETLHDQYSDIDGERVVFHTRSTVPSSLYFSAPNVVDTPLRTECFQHLPLVNCEREVPRSPIGPDW